ncbi:MAG TPA: oligosaccharide flippase family protein [Thermoleophilaceae bacterium]|nr:oligosaccharide flippase family protein [Thermoleophilaceae bacterium]
MAEGDPIAARIALGGRSLREHTARGTIINGAFSVGMAGLGLIRHLAIAAFLTASEFGLWGVVFASVTALLFVLEIGVSDKFVQQSEIDQETAFQKAFTVNLVWRTAFVLLAIATLPLFAQVYDRTDIILPGAVLALAVLGSALQSPLWIFYREMRFARERALHAVEPITGLVVTVALGAAGAGYWSLVIGGVTGFWVAGLVALRACPYPIRLRFDRRLFGEYFSFSWPIVVAAASGALTVQVAVIVGSQEVGLAGVGAIGLAATISRFAERVDHILTQTLYPAICAVRDRTELLFESFVKSNRVGLMWGIPFGVGLALFAPDVVAPVLGERWELAVGLLQVFGLVAAARQIAFNWPAYFLARGDTRPLAVHGMITFATFVAVGVPLMTTEGLTGYAIGIVAALMADLSVRAYYLTRLFSGFEMLRHSVRSIVPSIPAVALVLGTRLLESGERTLAMALAELSLYAVATAAATWFAERDLLRELLGYLRGTRGAPQAA